MFSTADGDLLRNDPRQMQLNLKQVATEQPTNLKEIKL